MAGKQADKAAIVTTQPVRVKPILFGDFELIATPSKGMESTHFDVQVFRDNEAVNIYDVPGVGPSFYQYWDTFWSDDRPQQASALALPVLNELRAKIQEVYGQ